MLIETQSFFVSHTIRTPNKSYIMQYLTIKFQVINVCAYHNGFLFDDYGNGRLDVNFHDHLSNVLHDYRCDACQDIGLEPLKR